MSVRAVFGPFAFDRTELSLWQDGVPVALTPKAAETLGLLLAEPGVLVTKERLRDTLWPEGFVEDGNLTQTIYMLRKTLDPEGDGRRFIETVPRRGYRFVAPVTLVETPPLAQRGAPPPLRTVRLRLAAATGVVVLLLAGSLISVAQSRTSMYPGLSTESSRAYALGRAFWNKRTLDATHVSIEYFSEVIKTSPNSALGYAGLADSYLMIANHAMVPGDLKPYYAKAEQYARDALARDPQSGEALATLGFIAYDRDHDRDRAERELRAALALRPLYASAHEFLGVILLQKGNVSEANDELKRAAELDPLSSIILCWLGDTYYYAHRFEDARRALRQSLDLDPNNMEAPYYLTLVHARLGQPREAYALLNGMRQMAMRGHDQHQKKMLDSIGALTALVALHAGDRKLADRMMPDLRPDPKRHVAFEIYAAICLHLGHRDAALAWLRQGINQEPWMTSRLLQYDPEFAELLGDPRFMKLVS